MNTLAWGNAPGIRKASNIALAEGHVQPHVSDLICDMNLAFGQKPAHDAHPPGALPQAEVKRRPSATKRLASDALIVCVGTP
jgi:hypothetical protein